MSRKGEISSLEAHLGYWLRMVSNHISHAFSQKVSEQDATVAEWVVLRELFAAGATTPSQIAERLRMTRGAISKLVDRLVGKGFVSKKSTKEDRRWQDIALTPKGRLLVPRLAVLADANDKEFFGQLTTGERAAFQRILKKLVRQRAISNVPID